MQTLETIRQNTKIGKQTFDILLILCASFLLSLSAQCAIPLPFTPVPITLQTCAIHFIAYFLGGKRAALAVFAYVVQGCLGFPVFAGGTFGLSILMGPRGGYILGFLVAAFLIGLLFEKKEKRTPLFSFIAFTLSDLLILLFGALGLSLFVGIKNALYLGVLPFLLGSSVKILFSLSLLSGSRKLIQRYKKNVS